MHVGGRHRSQLGQSKKVTSKSNYSRRVCHINMFVVKSKTHLTSLKHNCLNCMSLLFYDSFLPKQISLIFS